MNALLPCPFCGSDAICETFRTAGEKEDRFRIRCSNDKCGADMGWNWFAYKDAATAWNKRYDKEANGS